MGFIHAMLLVATTIPNTPSKAESDRVADSCSKVFQDIKYLSSGDEMDVMLSDRTICILKKPILNKRPGSGIPVIAVSAPNWPGYADTLKEIGAQRPGERKIIKHDPNSFRAPP